MTAARVYHAPFADLGSIGNTFSPGLRMVQPFVVDGWAARLAAKLKRVVNAARLHWGWSAHVSPSRRKLSHPTARRVPARYGERDQEVTEPVEGKDRSRIILRSSIINGFIIST